MIWNKKILIVGGGIAGPTAAIKLIELGAKVTIIEARNESDMDEGLFMGISPNGLNILSELIDISKIYDSFAPGSIHFLNSKGKKIAELDTGYQILKYGVGSVQLKRSLISKLLHEKLCLLGCPVLYNCKLNSIRSSGQKVSVETSKGSFDEFDMLIGADGIHSKCRSLVFSDTPKPNYTKLISTGSIVEIPNWSDHSGAMNMIFGENAFFGYATSNTGHIWWFNNFYRETLPNKKLISEDVKSELLKLHKNDHRIISEILGATNEFFTYPLYEMAPLKIWYDKNICLIGDAAHAVSPHTGQGASLALEDGAVLAKCLEKFLEPESAFSEFQRIRQDRVKKIIAQAGKVGNAKTKTNPIATCFRDLLLKIFIKIEKKKMDWVYAYDISKLF